MAIKVSGVWATASSSALYCLHYKCGWVTPCTVKWARLPVTLVTYQQKHHFLKAPPLLPPSATLARPSYCSSLTAHTAPWAQRGPGYNDYYDKALCKHLSGRAWAGEAGSMHQTKVQWWERQRETEWSLQADVWQEKPRDRGSRAQPQL